MWIADEGVGRELEYIEEVELEGGEMDGFHVEAGVIGEYRVLRPAPVPHTCVCDTELDPGPDESLDRAFSINRPEGGRGR